MKYLNRYNEITILNKADKNTANPKPKITDIDASPKPNGFKKKINKVAKRQTFKVEIISEMKPRVYGKGAEIFFVSSSIIIFFLNINIKNKHLSSKKTSHW